MVDWGPHEVVMSQQTKDGKRTVNSVYEDWKGAYQYFFKMMVVDNKTGEEHCMHPGLLMGDKREAEIRWNARDNPTVDGYLNWQTWEWIHRLYNTPTPHHYMVDLFRNGRLPQSPNDIAMQMIKLERERFHLCKEISTKSWMIDWYEVGVYVNEWREDYEWARKEVENEQI